MFRNPKTRGTRINTALFRLFRLQAANEPLSRGPGTTRRRAGTELATALE